MSTYTVLGHGRTTVNSGFSILGLPLQTSVLYQGVIASVSTNSFTDAAATWNTGDFATADPNGHSYTMWRSYTILILLGLVRSLRLRT